MACHDAPAWSVLTTLLEVDDHHSFSCADGRCCVERPLNFARNRHRSKSSRRLETLLGGVSSEFCSESIHGVRSTLRALLCGASSEFCSESTSPLDLGIVNSVNVCGISTRSCVELSQKNWSGATTLSVDAASDFGSEKDFSVEVLGNRLA